MRLSKKSEYACLALIELAKAADVQKLRIEDIAERNKIPKKYLEQILLQLNQSGYVKSTRGVNGGYQLAKKANDISVAEILRLIDGPLAPVQSVSTYYYAATPVEQNYKLLHLLKEIRDYVAIKMEETKFSDLI